MLLMLQITSHRARVNPSIVYLRVRVNAFEKDAYFLKFTSVL